MVKQYVPKQGDIVFFDFNPTKGHEQAGFRPAVVVSGNVFNQNTHMVMVCPVISNQKYFPTHYLLEDTKKFMVLFCVSILEVLIMKLGI